MKLHKLLKIFLVALVLAATVDLIQDYQEHLTWLHIGIESLLVIFGIVVLVSMTHKAGDLDLENERLKSDLNRVREQSADWRKEAGRYIKGLSLAIDTQFERWGLTAAEADVARLLLKGLGIKEIASLRGTSEKTVRHQSQGVYGKSGLSGRAELSAFFLEDLLGPVQKEAASHEDARSTLN